MTEEAVIIFPIHVQRNFFVTTLSDIKYLYDHPSLFQSSRKADNFGFIADILRRMCST
jgi:hypothetical protein